ncbi:MAG: FGGY-family carbohydrate kinase [Alphaproteobacteria bacterium]|nr:FGGY-family carbohydrate kinase [Alphaproteobacteria bacterium]
MAITLGLDIGTTSTIGILINATGQTLALASRPVTLHSEHPGWAEEDPEEWWRNVCDLVPELLTKSGRSAADIGAVGVTGMLPAVVLLDRSKKLLRRSIQQSDGRVGREVEAIAGEVDADDFVRRTGNGINQQLVATKLRWLERHEPDVFANIKTVFGSYDYINWRLTGERVIEHNWALEAGFLGLSSRRLDAGLVGVGHIDPGVLPPVRASHEIIGQVTPEAARLTGLAVGTPVIAGSADHITSAFVAGIRKDGDCLIKFGGAGDIMLAAASPKPDPRLFLDFHIVPGKFMPNGCMACSGAVLNWILSALAGQAIQAEKNPHSALDRLAAEIAPGADGLLMLPYFLGEKTPIHDPDARGTLVGLGLHHDIGHIWRAALEAVVFGFRHHMDVFSDLGQPATRLYASDGGAKSQIWMQIAADSLGLPVHLLKGHPGSCLGAAYIAAFAIGAVDDWDGISRFVTPADVVEPDTRHRARYDALYQAYRETYERLRPVYPKLADLP